MDGVIGGHMRKLIFILIFVLYNPVWVSAQGPSILPSDSAYNADTWNGSTLSPTQNAIRDKIVSMEAAALANPMDSAGDIIIGGALGAPAKLDAGTQNYLLQANGAAAPTWVTDLTIGDITVGGGNINTGNIPLVIGDNTTDSITLRTDGGDVTVPEGTITLLDTTTAASTYAPIASPALTGDPTITDATPTLTLQDSDNAAGTAAINFNSSGGANDIVATVGVEDSTGASTPYQQWDGVTETVDFLKDATLANGGVLRTSETTEGHTFALQVYDNTAGSWKPALTFTNGITGAYKVTLGAGVTLDGLGALALDTATLDVPNSAADVALADAGKVHLNTTDEQLSFHSAADGQISGEVALSLLDHIVWSGDPGAAYDSDAEWGLMTVGVDYPEGIHIVKWTCDCNVADPDVEINADLRYADDWGTLANPTDIDEIDTTTGSSVEDTDANINGGAAVPTGKVIYIGNDGDPEGTCTQMVFEMWFYGEED
jgi:hypothetical protein